MPTSFSLIVLWDLMGKQEEDETKNENIKSLKCREKNQSSSFAEDCTGNVSGEL